MIALGREEAPRLSVGGIVVRVMVGLFLLVLGAELALLVYSLPIYPAWAGHDFTTYRDAASRWLSGDGFYLPYQMQPYTITEREIMYPPYVLALLVPFTVLPAALWWIVPLGIVAWSLRGITAERLLLVLVLLTVPVSHGVSWALDMIVNGNPAMWAAAGVAMGVRYGAGPLSLVKPAPLLLPFALLGFRSRGWWVSLGLIGAVSLLLLPMWPDYLRVLLNAHGADPLYMVYSLPLIAIPLMAAGRLPGRA